MNGLSRDQMQIEENIVESKVIFLFCTISQMVSHT